MKALRTFSFTQRVALREWLILLAGMLLLALGLGWQNGLGRLDQALYDQFVSANGRPARSDIIIVAIDDYSLAELGRWPWSRTLHAQLLNQITKAHPRAVGIDIILSEPERSQANYTRRGDAALHDALMQSGLTVLPVVTVDAGAGLVASKPISEFANAARALGHIDLEHDSDGVVRSVFLREGRNGVWWPHFSLALFNTYANNGLSGGSMQPVQSGASAGGWERADQMHIPFAGNNGHFQSVPYASVLRGEVPPQFFTGKYVLIGATAFGMADAYPTPVSGSAGAMPGIEIHANILASLLDRQAIAIARPWQTMLFSALPALAAMLGYLLLAPRIALVVTGMLLLLTTGTSFLMLRAGLWIAPSAALATLTLSYPLWSWRRLEAAIAYLGQEFVRLDREPHLLPEAGQQETPDQIEDVLEQRITAMKNAARRVRDLRQFVSDSLEHLPDATLVVAVDGRILLANRQASEYFASLGLEALAGTSIIHALVKLRSPQPIDQVGNTKFNWSDLLDLQCTPILANGIGVRDEYSRDLLVKCAPCRSASNLLTGWIVSLIDISTIRAAERSRDEMLRFLSHDMRAPQASILALLDLQSVPSSAIPQEEFFARIEKASRRTLGLADNFVQLARAESQEYRLEEVDFQDLLLDAIDEMWTLAKNKNISLTTDIAEGEFPVRVDRTLMTRALVNLLSNAINYSPHNTRVLCTLRHSLTVSRSQVFCSITDQGYGIAPTDQTRLFQRFQRVDVPGQPRHDGIGLGLAFVKTVVERHYGQLAFSSEVGEGTTFTLTLPGQAA